MNDATLNLAERQPDDFLISRLPLEPEGVVSAPLGDVLLAGFDGQAAYAWIKHHPNEARIMNLLTLPTGGPFRLDRDEGFQSAVHVTSFFKMLPARVKLEHLKSAPHMSAWHVFAWYPLPESIPTVQKPAINAKSSTVVESARIAGIAARQAGKTLKSNPYVSGFLSRAWIDGYQGEDADINSYSGGSIYPAPSELNDD